MRSFFKYLSATGPARGAVRNARRHRGYMLPDLVFSVIASAVLWCASQFGIAVGVGVSPVMGGSPPRATKLLITAQPSDGSAGDNFTIAIGTADAAGNAVPKAGVEFTLTLNDTDSVGASLAGTVTGTTDVNGEATLSAWSIAKFGRFTVTVSDDAGDLDSATSDSFVNAFDYSNTFDGAASSGLAYNYWRASLGRTDRVAGDTFCTAWQGQIVAADVMVQATEADQPTVESDAAGTYLGFEGGGDGLIESSLDSTIAGATILTVMRDRGTGNVYMNGVTGAGGGFNRIWGSYGVGVRVLSPQPDMTTLCSAIAVMTGTLKAYVNGGDDIGPSTLNITANGVAVGCTVSDQFHNAQDVYEFAILSGEPTAAQLNEWLRAVKTEASKGGMGYGIDYTAIS